jgi:hypothetical protein
VIAATATLTVTLDTAKQPPPLLYVILAVPAATPFTTPVLIPTVALVAALLVHVPPETELVIDID